MQTITLWSYDCTGKKGFYSKKVECTDFSKIKNISVGARFELPHCDYCHEQVRRVGEDGIDVCENCDVVEGHTHDFSQCEECNEN